MTAPVISRPILSVRRLTVAYRVQGAWPWARPGVVRAIDDLHFDLFPGEALGIAGEAGCGKTTLARALVGLQPVTSGGMVLDPGSGPGTGGRDLARLDEAQWCPLRREIQMVFPDPVASFDPLLTLGDSVAEPLLALCPDLDEAARRQRVAEMLARVGLEPELAQRFPSGLTAAQCRLAGLARALVVKPRVLVFDEPVAAPEAQAPVLALLAELQREEGLSIVLLARDLGAVRELCQRVLVLYLGRVMEQAPAEELFAQPRHPYTRALLGSAPLAGEPPDPLNPPSGCVFRTRCPMADDLCAREVPYLARVGARGHAACHYVQGAAEIEERP